MPIRRCAVLGLFVGSAIVNLQAAVLYVDLNSQSPEPPYSTWQTAATNIQHAIDAAAPGDTVLVTNGVYASGGKAVLPAQTNRIALDKPLTVRSVNGPYETIIQGQQDTNIYGPSAVRCAWLTNDAVLEGFTLRGGATAASGDNSYSGGGGAWCASTNALLKNCVIIRNRAHRYGGGAFSGTLERCIVSDNLAQYGGGGSYKSVLNYCLVKGNFAVSQLGVYDGAGASGGTLNNCTVTQNIGNSGLLFCDANNCIIWGNLGFDEFGCKLRYSCTQFRNSGEGNIFTDPMLLADGTHISEASPCRARGKALPISGTDIDGQPIAAVPSMGCDEWYPDPVITERPALDALIAPRTIGLVASVGGQGQFEFLWAKDGSALHDDAQFSGTSTATLLLKNPSPDHAGSFQAVARNAHGSVTSRVATVSIRCVDVSGSSPTPPYLDWNTAATNIQDAVDNALEGEVLLVAKGIYSSGGRVVDGLTNRVVIDKPIILFGVEGPANTIIRGQWDPVSTNGPAAVRCAWLCNGPILSGFTLAGGATLTTTNATEPGSGGGVFASWKLSHYATPGLLFNCILTGNAADEWGGGAVYAALSNCTLSNNVSFGYGGGSYQSSSTNCLFLQNRASFGGAAAWGDFYNCTFVGNYSRSESGDMWQGFWTNCIFWQTLPANPYKTQVDPLFVDPASGDYRLKPNSPFINAGSNLQIRSAVDMDGNPRIIGGTVDLGVYECQAPALLGYYTWLQEHNQPTGTTSNTSDPDGDRLTNWQEWLTGTDPTNGASALVVQSVVQNQTGNIVTWQSVTGRSYQIDRATNLTTSAVFAPLAGGIAGEPFTTSFTDPNPPANGTAFYRVSVRP